MSWSPLQAKNSLKNIAPCRNHAKLPSHDFAHEQRDLVLAFSRPIKYGQTQTKQLLKLVSILDKENNPLVLRALTSQTGSKQ